MSSKAEKSPSTLELLCKARFLHQVGKRKQEEIKEEKMRSKSLPWLPPDSPARGQQG